MKRKPTQLLLPIKEHGGRRKNAGRKKLTPGAVNHDKRERINARTPLHITYKLRKGLGNLRTLQGLDAFSQAAMRAQAKDFRIIHFSVQSNHVHLLVETTDNASLEKGTKSFATAFAKAINKITKRAGRVFLSRFHLHVLKSTREAKHAVDYVLFNFEHHSGRPVGLDPFSSVHTQRQIAGGAQPPPWVRLIRRAISGARTWLLTEGWRRG